MRSKSSRQTFYSVGFIGMIFSIDVITADTSSLKDRGLAYAFTASPWIITAYAGAALSQYFHENDWRWAYGSFAIILPFVGAGLATVLQYNKRKARRAGKLVREKSGRTAVQSLVHYLIEFDSEYERVLL